MPSELNYCDGCGHLITPGVLASGAAIVTPERILCPSCVQALPPEERAALTGGAFGADPHDSADSAGAAEPGAPKTNLAVTIAGSVTGFLVALAATLVVLYSAARSERGEAPRPEPLPWGLAAEPPPGAPGVERAAEAVRTDADDAADEPPGADTVEVSQDEGRQAALVAFETAQEKASALSDAGDFDGALATLDALAVETAVLVGAEIAGAREDVTRAARDRVEAAETEVARYVAAGDVASARALLGELSRLRIGAALPDAAARSRELESAVTRAERAAAEAREREVAEAIEKALAEFHDLYWSESYAEARDRMAKVAEGAPDGELRRTLFAAADVAGIAAERGKVLRERYVALKGGEVDVEASGGRRKGKLLDVSDEGLTIEWTYRIGSTERSKTHTIKWGDLTPKETAARLEGWREGDPARRIAEALAALDRGELDSAERILEEAEEHPLAGYLRRRARTARLGQKEAAAVEAWEAIWKAASAPRLSEERAREILADLGSFRAAHEGTKCAAEHAKDIDDLRARLEVAGKVLLPGLVARYTDQGQYRDRPKVCIDRAVDFEWGQGRPLADVASENFAVEWTGLLRADTSETYTLTVHKDDHAQLFVDDGELDVSRQGGSDQVPLVAGKLHKLRVLFREVGNVALMHLYWESPSVPKQIVPAENLFHYRQEVDGPAAAQAPPLPGLVGRYWSNREWRGPAKARVDAEILFEWGQGSPGMDVPADNFTARWTGYVRPPGSGSYTFSLRADDVAALWIDGKRLTGYTRGVTATATADLSRETFHAIRIDYREDSHNSALRLEWSGPAVAKGVVPAKFLFHAAADHPAAGR